jgi:hypothetical protein
MPKPKTIKLNATNRKEMDKLQRFQAIAYYGVETANKQHFEACERLWTALCSLYPELKKADSKYHEGIVTYTPREEP